MTMLCKILYTRSKFETDAIDNGDPLHFGTQKNKNLKQGDHFKNGWKKKKSENMNLE